MTNGRVIETHRHPRWSIGSLSNNDGDGFENVSWHVCSRCLKLYRACSISFCSSDVGEFFWSWILKGCIKVQEKKKRAVVLCSRPPQKKEIRPFDVVVVQRWQRNVQKSVIEVRSCCFANLTLLLFCRPRCRRRGCCLSSLIGWFSNRTATSFHDGKTHWKD